MPRNTVMKRLALVLILGVGGAAEAAAPAPVAADHAMVVSAQALATATGLQILKAGGNVVDAAVAVGYALAVVYPAAGNLGGGGFMTIRFADGRTTFLDFREKAPIGATAAMFLDAKGEVAPNRSTDSWLAVGVPGSVAGLDAALQRYGSLPRAVVMAPAIALARDGFALEDGDIGLLRLGREGLAKDPAATAIFQTEQSFLPGDLLRQPELAQTLERIAASGPAAFYDGPIGQEIVAASQAGGGILQAKDLTDYKVREYPTVGCTYRGFRVETAPPPSGGGIALCEMLNILEGYDLTGMGFHSAAEVHVMSEAMRLAFRDRNSALGDPDFVQNPVGRLISKEYAVKLRADIPDRMASPQANPQQAAPQDVTPPSAAAPTAPQAGEGRQTTHYSIADAAGNAVSVTTTLNGWFGARRVAGHTGILMNNEMDDFTSKTGTANMFGLVQGEANGIAPGKTPLSSMAPTVVSRDGKLLLVLGSPGGSRIITTLLEIIVNLVDHGMGLSEAIDAPRFHAQGLPTSIAAEPFALSPDTRDALTASGHEVRDTAPWGMAAGILVDGPSLFEPPAGTHVLEVPSKFAPQHKLYGAEDARSQTGAAGGY